MSEAPAAPRLPFVLAAVASAGLVALSTSYAALSADLGWILRFGHEVLASGAIPRTNGWSFATPDHPLVMHEWLACVLFAAVHGVWGAVGLTVVKWGLVLATLLVVADHLRVRAIAPVPAFVTIAAVAHGLHLGATLVRPQLFTLLGLALVLRLADGVKARTPWLLPIVFAVWANLHGGWVAGLPVVWIVLFFRGFRDGVGSRTSLVPIAVLSFVALFLNPYGPSLLGHTLHHVSDDVRLLNREWLPLWSTWPPGPVELFGLAFLGVTAVVWFAGRKGVAPVWFAVGIVAAVAGVLSVRNLRWMPILLAPGTAGALSRLWSMVPSAAVERTSGGVVPVTALAAVLTWGPVALDPLGAMRFSEQRDEDPGAIVWFVRRHALSGTVWNDFNWGGSLAWVTPSLRVAVDGRNVAAYAPEFLRDAMTWPDRADPTPLLAPYSPDFVLVRERARASATLRKTFVPLTCAQGLCLFARDASLAERIGNADRLPPREIGIAEYFQHGRPEDAGLDELR